ncbi:MAG TPA: hypothetical protein VMB78_04125, partial [Dissulfurispiraceae bacterium]|nr:hypothetical protein [Dissulfurispiraceae bacterium]
GQIAQILLCSFFLVTTFFGTARADMNQFIPRTYENGADIEVTATRETDSFKGGGGTVKTSDLFIREKLSLYSEGYSYDPRFVQYHLMVATALKQENFTDSASGFSGSSRTNASALEYDVKLYILPEHPYKLNLFMSRLEPLYRQEFATQTNNIDSNRGAVFSYRQKPYFLNLSYIENITENSQSRSDVRTLSGSGTYYKEFISGRKVSLSLSYDHSDFSSMSLFKGTSNIYGLNSTVDLKRALLETNFSKTTFHQEDSSGPADSDNLLWRERLSIFLPLNFKSVLTYQYQKNANSFGSAAVSSSSAISDTDKSIEVDIIHKLYQSLDSVLILLRDSKTSSLGDITQTSYALTESYSKRIPWGTFLSGVSISRAVTDSTGTISIVNEPHSGIMVPGSFILSSQNPDPSTIRVYLKDPLPPFEPILLEEVTNYTVTPVGNTFQITITNLPPPFVPVGNFDFTVSYSLTSGNFKLQTNSYGFNAGANLFESLVNPYISYVSTSSKVLQGIFPGGPVDERYSTIGVTIQKLPFRVLAEYQKLQSNINPYTQWKGEINCTTPVTETSRIYLVASYTRKNYPVGSSLLEQQPYTEMTETVSANVQKQFFQRSLVLTAGGAYSAFQGLVKSTAFSLNTSLEWKIGKIFVGIGASGYMAKSEGSGTLQNERDHQYYYVNIKRKIF